jgi:DNA-binding NarL/FixJ family response regulator
VFIDHSFTKEKNQLNAQKTVSTIKNHVKLQSAKDKIIVLMITDSDNSIISTLKTDATGYVSKPICKEDWIHRIQNYIRLGNYESEQSLRQKLLPERRGLFII